MTMAATRFKVKLSFMRSEVCDTSQLCMALERTYEVRSD